MTANYKVTRYCLCGASASISSSQASQVAEISAMFDQFHAGEGHGPATQAEAARARRKAFSVPSAPSTPGGGG